MAVTDRRRVAPDHGDAPDLGLVANALRYDLHDDAVPGQAGQQILVHVHFVRHEAPARHSDAGGGEESKPLRLQEARPAGRSCAVDDGADAREVHGGRGGGLKRDHADRVLRVGARAQDTSFVATGIPCECLTAIRISGILSHMAETITAEARLRERNQLTIPDAIVQAAGFEPGAIFVVETSLADPETLVLRLVRRSYAGAARGLYGDPVAYLDRERGSWG